MYLIFRDELLNLDNLSKIEKDQVIDDARIIVLKTLLKDYRDLKRDTLKDLSSKNSIFSITTNTKKRQAKVHSQVIVHLNLILVV